MSLHNNGDTYVLKPIPNSSSSYWFFKTYFCFIFAMFKIFIITSYSNGNTDQTLRFEPSSSCQTHSQCWHSIYYILMIDNCSIFCSQASHTQMSFTIYTNSSHIQCTTAWLEIMLHIIRIRLVLS